MTHTFRSRLGLILIGALLLPVAAGAELAKWDQERVTGYASELAKACSDLSVAVRQEAGATQDPSQQNAMYRVQESVKVLCTTSRQLEANLKDGRGRDETTPIYMKMPTLRRDAEEDARRALITESTMDKVFAVGGPLMRLRPYYEEEPKAAETTGAE
jgi:hypothetical protein